jgi:hypothetical protein
LGTTRLGDSSHRAVIPVEKVTWFRRACMAREAQFLTINSIENIYKIGLTNIKTTGLSTPLDLPRVQSCTLREITPETIQEST